MGENNSSYFPINGPRQWSYTSEFETLFPETGKMAKRSIGSTTTFLAHYNTVSKMGPARRVLIDLIGIAKAAENKYLASHNITNANPDDWSELIKGINYILGTKASFDYNIKKLEQLNKSSEEGGIKEYKDISKKLYEYLEKEAIKIIKNNLNASPSSLVEIILQKGIDRMRDYKVKDEDGKMIQPYYQLYDVIKVGKDNVFLKSMLEIYKLEDFITEYQKYLLSGEKGTAPTLKVKGSKVNAASSAEELLAQKTMGELAKIHADNSSGAFRLTVDAQNPGPLNYKPDAALFEATYAADFKSSSKEIEWAKSSRVRGVRTSRQWFKHLEEAKGSLVISSNKNYFINELFKNGGERNGKEVIPGFSAQSPMSLENFSAFGNELNLSGVKMDYLIDYLANLGSYMILGDTAGDDILKDLAAQVGHFLFDDLTITPPSNLNVVHVFRLSGIYVPLSFVLSCVEQSLNLSIEEMQKSVNVMILTGDSLPGDWSEDEFTNFRNKKLKENKIKIHFLANFAELITKNVKI